MFVYNGKNLLNCETNKLNRDDFIVDHNDPILFCGNFIDQRIKGTPGITG